MTPHRIGAWETGTHGEVPSITRSLTRADRGRILFISDLHLDSSHADRNAIRYALDQAMELDAPIAILGDLVDVMQVAGDKRASKSALIERYHGRDDYLNAIVEDVEGFLKPYAKNIWLMLHGNHEASVTKYHEVDLLRLIAMNLNRQGASIATPGYQTHVAMKLRNSTSKHGDLLIGWLTHGAGGNAVVTGGVMHASRRAGWVPQADFFVSGHLHRPFDFPVGQVRMSQSGRVYKQWITHVQCGAWKNESVNAPNWPNQKGMAPTPVGPAWWLEVRQARGERALPRWAVNFIKADT